MAPIPIHPYGNALHICGCYAYFMHASVWNSDNLLLQICWVLCSQGISWFIFTKIQYWKWSHYDANLVITSGTAGCHKDNLRYHQWWPSWHHDNCWFSVKRHIVSCPTWDKHSEFQVYSILVICVVLCWMKYHTLFGCVIRTFRGYPAKRALSAMCKRVGPFWQDTIDLITSSIWKAFIMTTFSVLLGNICGIMTAVSSCPLNPRVVMMPTLPSLVAIKSTRIAVVWKKRNPCGDRFSIMIYKISAHFNQCYIVGKLVFTVIHY